MTLGDLQAAVKTRRKKRGKKGSERVVGAFFFPSSLLSLSFEAGVFCATRTRQVHAWCPREVCRIKTGVAVMCSSSRFEPKAWGTRYSSSLCLSEGHVHAPFVDLQRATHHELGCSSSSCLWHCCRQLHFGRRCFVPLCDIRSFFAYCTKAKFRPPSLQYHLFRPNSHFPVIFNVQRVGDGASCRPPGEDGF